jgi:ABC-type uncharacterized transport system auxiliary subunit
MRSLVLVVALAACSSKSPDTRFYQLALLHPRAPVAGDITLVVEPLTTDPAYDDERIVYRPNPYRLDYYHYHRWSAAPGMMIGNYLEEALERSGRFRAVRRDLTADAPVVLGGRVVAIEEVDRSRTQWHGRLVIELTLTDVKTNRVLWSEQFEETEPLRAQTPEGLARALSVAMSRIVAKAAPVIEAHASDRVAQLTGGR